VHFAAHRLPRCYPPTQSEATTDKTSRIVQDAFNPFSYAEVSEETGHAIASEIKGGGAMSSPVVLITGALTGIGRVAAFTFAQEGAQVERCVHPRGWSDQRRLMRFIETRG
jgi:hypothetical protein